MNEVANGKIDIETLTIQTKFHNQILNRNYRKKLEKTKAKKEKGNSTERKLQRLVTITKLCEIQLEA